MQGQKPQKWLTTARIAAFCIALILIIIGGYIWIRGSLGSQSTLFGAIFVVVSAIISLLQLVPQLKPSQATPSTSPIPVSQPVHVHVHTTPEPTSVTPTPPPPAPDIPSIYRSVAAQPPNTNPQTIQQREPVVKDVYAKLTQPNISALVLTGIGGLGKSTLAALVYNYVEQQRRAGRGIFKRETLWLRVDEKTTFLDIAENLFTALGNRPANFAQLSPQAQAYAIVHLISTLDEPQLIVIDQFENLLNLDTGEALTPETGELLDALNSRTLSSRILLTSRPRPKGISATPAGSLSIYPVDGLTPVEGQALLVNQGVKGTQEELQHAVELCGGHGLALYLLVSLLDDNKISLFTLFNDQNYDNLWGKDVAEKLLDKIYKERLNDEQREVIQAYSIYREPVPQDAILPLLSDNANARLVELLRTLKEHQLLLPVEGGHRQLHPIVATYAQHHDEQYNKEGMLIAHSKAAQYYIQQAAKQCPPREERKKQGKIAEVQPLIEAVWQLCQAERWQEAYEAMDEEGLFDDIRRWGGNAFLLEIGEDLRKGVAQLKPLQVADLYHQLGWICDELGKKKDALKYYEQALAIWVEQKDRKREGATLNSLGELYDDLGKKAQAIQYYEQALAIRKEVRDRAGEGTTLNDLGLVYYGLGKRQEALQYYEQALIIRRDVGERKGEGATLHNLGLLYKALGRQEEAMQYYEQALAIRKEVGDRGGEGRTLNNIGKMCDDMGKWEAAAQYYEQALVIRMEVGDRRGEGVTLNNIGKIYDSVEKQKEAMQYYKQALAIRRELEDLEGEGVTLNNIGVVYKKNKIYDTALSFFILAQRIFVEIQNPRNSDVQKLMNDLHQEIGDERFAALWKDVEPRAEEIVEKALGELE